MEKEFLYKEYIDNKKSIQQISKEFKYASMSIYDALIKFEIPIRKSKKFQIPQDILYLEYVENKKTIQKISEIFGCSFSVIQTLIKKYNIEARIGRNPKTSILNKKLLEQLYVHENLRIRHIANKLKFSERHISNKLKEFGIPRKRAIKQSLKVDLTGRVFNKITVLSIFNEEDNIWICQCVCGVKKNIWAGNLLDRKKSSRSCGCSRIETDSDWKIIPPYYWNKMEGSASGRGIKFELDKEYLEELYLKQNKKYLEELYLKQNKKCALSGVDIIFERARNRWETTASLDRIDSDQGYIQGNVQWVHKILNIAKHKINNKEFINWCKLIAEFNK